MAALVTSALLLAVFLGKKSVKEEDQGEGSTKIPR
jgi:hypothetical protein